MLPRSHTELSLGVLGDPHESSEVFSERHSNQKPAQPVQRMEHSVLHLILTTADSIFLRLFVCFSKQTGPFMTNPSWSGQNLFVGLFSGSPVGVFRRVTGSWCVQQMAA